MDGGVWVTVLVAFLTGGGIAGLISAIVSWRKSGPEREKTEAEAADIIARAATEVTKNMEKRLCAMQNEIDQLREENKALKEEVAELREMCEQFDDVLSGAHALYDQLVENHHKPRYKPPERRKKNDPPG